MFSVTNMCFALQINGPTAHNARGFVSAQMFNRKGEVFTVNSYIISDNCFFASFSFIGLGPVSVEGCSLSSSFHLLFH